MNPENPSEQEGQTFGESLINSEDEATREAIMDMLNRSDMGAHLIEEAKTPEQQEEIKKLVEAYKFAQAKEKAGIREKMEKLIDDLWEANRKDQ